jgi:hypothetical protein
MPETIYWSPKAIEHLRGIKAIYEKDAMAITESYIE